MTPSIFFGFAVADGMFQGDVNVARRVMTPEEAKSFIGENQVISALNPSHTATINAMNTRYGISVQIPASAPKVLLNPGDQIIVMSVRGLPRREGVAEYTQTEVDGASFEFSRWTVLPATAE